MKSAAPVVVAAVALLFGARASADTGEQVYENRCSLCHAGGAGGAPKLGSRDDWAPRAARGKLALYESALKGKPNTAMMARGGFRDLSNDEVMSAVDYMVTRAGLQPELQPAAAPGATAPDDETVSAQVAEALRAQLAPGAKVETRKWMASVEGLGVRVATREGVVWLSGTVKTVEIMERAEAIAKSAGGGRRIENKLVPASIFEWD
jgi:cytochrome c5